MSKEENLECSFCGRKKAETNLLIAGLDAHICDKCIEQAQVLLEEEVSETNQRTVKRFNVKKPKEIKDVFRSIYYWTRRNEKSRCRLLFTIIIRDYCRQNNRRRYVEIRKK